LPIVWLYINDSGVNSIKTRLTSTTKHDAIKEKGVGDEESEIGEDIDNVRSSRSDDDEDDEEDEINSQEAEDTDTLSPLPDSNNVPPVVVPRANHDGSYHSSGPGQNINNGIFPQTKTKEDDIRPKSKSESSAEKYGEKEYLGQRSHFGSFYLRIGAVAFGMLNLPLQRTIESIRFI
jgi:hypothetical protein